MKKLRLELTEKFENDVSQKALKNITTAARGLLNFEDKGIAVSMIVTEEGKSCLFSSHITEDIEKIASRIIYVNNGEIILDELPLWYGIQGSKITV